MLAVGLFLNLIFLLVLFDGGGAAARRSSPPAHSFLLLAALLLAPVGGQVFGQGVVDVMGGVAMVWTEGESLSSYINRPGPNTYLLWIQILFWVRKAGARKRSVPPFCTLC